MGMNILNVKVDLRKKEVHYYPYREKTKRLVLLECSWLWLTLVVLSDRKLLISSCQRLLLDLLLGT